MLAVKQVWARHWQNILGLLAVVIWALAGLHPAQGWIWAAYSITFLLGLPGYLIYTLIAGKHQARSLWKIVAYSMGLSLVYLMAAGLILNQAYVWAHYLSPLSLKPLVITIASSTTVLIVLAALRAKPSVKLQLIYRHSSGWWLAVTGGVAMPLLAIGGANTLNNGGPSYLALGALGLAGLYFLVLAWSKRDISKIYPFVLFSIGLTILLGTSLRGWNITGHDIMQEFQVFQLTSAHSVWRMSNYQDAYNACLSITILPTIFQRLTGISAQYVFKFIYQLFFALLAPVIYLSLKDYTPKATAFLSGFIFLTFPTFLTDITMLNRQETALLCFALALMAGLDKALNKWQRGLLVLIFLVGMILSHYATSYVAVSVLLIAAMLGIVSWIYHKLFRKSVKLTSKNQPAVISLGVTIAVALALFGWNTLATHTSSNFDKTLAGIKPGIVKIFKPGHSGISTVQHSAGSAELITNYALSTQAVRTLPSADYYSSKNTATYPVSSSPETLSKESGVLKSLHVPQKLLYQAYDKIRKLYAFLIAGLSILGMGLLLFFRKRFVKLSTFPAQYILLGTAGVIAIAAQLVLPASVIDYGLLRLIQQNLILLAFPIVLAGMWFAKILHIPAKAYNRMLASLLVIFFLILSGVLASLTGGYRPALALNNSGFYYQAYYTHQAEISADQWLNRNIPEGSRVYSDEFTRRQLIAYAGIFSAPTLVPGAMPVDSYVYIGNTETATSSVPVYVGSDLVYYAVPFNFLNANKNLVYSSGEVMIYK